MRGSTLYPLAPLSVTTRSGGLAALGRAGRRPKVVGRRRAGDGDANGAFAGEPDRPTTRLFAGLANEMLAGHEHRIRYRELRGPGAGRLHSLARAERSLLAHRPARALPAVARRSRLRAPRGATRRSAAAEGHRRQGALQGRDGVGRIHRAARGRQYRCRPPARVGICRRGEISRGHRCQSRGSSLPDRRAAVSGGSRSTEGGTGPCQGYRAARDV